MWNIGNITIKRKVGLAPMAGISNPAYMKICEEMECGFCVTELISSEAIVRNNKKTFDMLNGIDKLNIPIGIQIFGNNPITMSKAAKILVEKYNVKFIDINMGCPVPKVALNGAGSGLLKTPDKVYSIVKAVVDNVDVPVTVKIRSGWDKDSINAIEIAKIIEKAGASAICVHPRTRTQGYSGTANWDIIKDVKKSVNIKVIGNGDIKNCYDAKRMLEETNCDAIMIGRAALGNPWIIKETVEYLEKGIIPSDISKVDKINMIKKHLNYLLETKDEKVALLEIRNHAAWYLKGIKNTKELKENIFKTKTKKEIIDLLDKYLIDNT